MYTLRWLTTLLITITAACGSGDNGTVAETSPTSQKIAPTQPDGASVDPPGTSSECDDPDQEVDSEPDWRQFADYREWTREGCLIRIDVLADRAGPAQCGFDSVRVITTGSAVGERYTSSDSTSYIRDPEGVMSDGERFVPDATLPPTAEDSGYRSADNEELWLDPKDQTAIYLVSADNIERIPRGSQVLCD